MKTTNTTERPLLCFLVLSWLALAVHVATFGSFAQLTTLSTAAWTLAVTLSYSFIYLIPATVLSVGTTTVARRLAGSASRWWVAAVLIGTTGLTHVLLFADRMIHSMYGFHINGFVIDLVTTPGGIASLGASTSTQVTATAIVAGLLLLQFVLYRWALHSSRTDAAPSPFRHWRRVLIVLLVFATVGERLAYAYSAVVNYRPILTASDNYPLYLPLSLRKVAKKLGIKEVPRSDTALALQSGALAYPVTPLQIEKPARSPNIVWLVAESMRFDLLDPKTMPALWRFSEDSLRLKKHFSGGNLTQMGVFSMFYGLYANYWFPMLDNQRSPVLIDVLQQQNYQFSLYTSQRFTYPAFDKTVFVHMNPQDMHELQNGKPAWQRDVTNIDQMLDFIDHRDTSRPFMTYMFFESTHANYDFPPEAVIAKPYLDDLNYLTADFKGDISAIKARYVNAAHHIDGQIGRVIEHLKDKKLLDNTIVIVLGDHGEEFMERGRWGHSAEFNRFQTSTPAVIHVPGQAPRVVQGITSHLDIPATLMPLLGVKNPASDYSLGNNLLDPGFHREYAVAGDWNRLAYIGNDFKIAFPVNATGSAVHDEATDGNDDPLADPTKAKAEIRPAMVEMMQNLARFTHPRS